MNPYAPLPSPYALQHVGDDASAVAPLPNSLQGMAPPPSPSAGGLTAAQRTMYGLAVVGAAFVLGFVVGDYYGLNHPR